MSELLSIIRHEIGHAIVGITLGGRLKSITINKYDFSGETSFKRYPTNPCDNIAISLAGLAGERIDNKAPGRIFSQKDVFPVQIEDDLSEIYFHLPDISDALLNQGLAVAWRILQENRHLHARLSERMMTMVVKGPMCVTVMRYADLKALHSEVEPKAAL